MSVETNDMFMNLCNKNKSDFVGINIYKIFPTTSKLYLWVSEYEYCLDFKVVSEIHV